MSISIKFSSIGINVNPSPHKFNLLDALSVLTDDEPCDTTGHHLWTGSLALAKFIDKNQNLFMSKSILELGAGLGLCSILASTLSDTVICTDGDEESLELAASNYRANHSLTKSSISFSHLLWEDLGTADKLVEIYTPIDIVIGGDIIYTESAMQNVIHISKRLLKNNGLLVIGYCPRDGFPSKLLNSFTQYAKDNRFILIKGPLFISLNEFSHLDLVHDDPEPLVVVFQLN
ncbi:hypothetical protein P9112_000959 [Eukaryota sp. TZLM1-RC]